MTFKEVLSSKEYVLVDFFATWCGPCKMMAPILSKVKAAVADDTRIIKIDIDKNQALAQAYNVRSVPTLMLFKNGDLVWQRSGVVQAQEMLNAIQEAKQAA